MQNLRGGQNFSFPTLLDSYREFLWILWRLNKFSRIITLAKSKSRPRVSTNLGKTSFKFSAPKIWETVPPGLKCLPYHKFKKEWKSCLLTNQIWPCLYVLSLILSEILFPLFTAADYLNMNGVQQESSCFFGHCTQMNLMLFIYQPFYFPTYVNLCEYLI